MATPPMGPGGRPPAWYPDPDRADRLRYWDGTDWTGRRRPRPRWSTEGPDVLAVAGPSPIDSPARAAELPAPAAGVGTSRQAQPATPPGAGDGGPGASSTTDPPAPIRRPADDGPPPPEGPSGPSGGGGGGGGGEGGGGPRRGRRYRWVIYAAIAVLAAGGVALAGQAMTPKAHEPRVLTDTTYIRLANAQCNTGLAALRPPDAGPFGTTITPAQSADSADKAADGMVRLATTLRNIPSAAADRPYINTWLDNWDHYAALGHQYATFLRQHGTASPPRSLQQAINQTGSAADNFSLANGLKACEFTSAPVEDPSDGF